MAETKHASEPNDQRNYEVRDLTLRPIVVAGLVLTGVVIIAVIAMNLLYGFLAGQADRVDQPLPPLASSEQLPPEPRLQVSPAQDMTTLRAHEDEILHSYGWVDQDAEIVRIPIERAMELLIERGLPTRPQE